ncbi:MAG TPA: aspartate carbamoyltransferase catalytic subunit [Aliiroseovarius sp.]|nr:aspartate carbamoyltransferase catalytic subunit [Aliiroseovarius sp.]
MNQIKTGWESILDDDETILWQGRPSGAVRLKPGNIVGMLGGLGFAGFALFWMIMASKAGGGFWMFGLIHFTVGLSIAFGAIFWNAFRRRFTWYTLTNKRAIIATDLPVKGRVLKSYPIRFNTVLEYEPGPPATIIFSEELRRGSKGRRYTVKIGFEQISDGDRVYRLMRDVQRDAQRLKQESNG